MSLRVQVVVFTTGGAIDFITARPTQAFSKRHYLTVHERHMAGTLRL
jgi:hypothetical protein